MMKTLEKSQDKIKKICALLREETLEPAQKEAQTIIEKAQKQAEEMIADAKKSAEQLHAQAKAAIEQEHLAFQSSLQQASNQGLEALRQSIEKNFFNDHLATLIEKGISDPNLIANLIHAIISVLEKEGLASDLTVVVAKTIVPRQLNELLMQDVLKNLKDHSVQIGNFKAGIQVKVNQKTMTIDISEGALKELLATYMVRKDFRKLIFADPI